MEKEVKPIAKKDEVIALRGEGDDIDELRYVGVADDGVHIGYMYRPAEDITYSEMPIESMLVHGYWRAPEGATFISSSETDDEELDRIGLVLVTALVLEDEIRAVEYRIIGTDEVYYRVDSEWESSPDTDDLEGAEEYIIEPEIIDSFLAEYDKKDPELFGKIAEYEASDSFMQKAFPPKRNF